MAVKPTGSVQVEEWLRDYQGWQQQLRDHGLYRVPDEGTRVQSNREGRPTENTVIQLYSLTDRLRTVEGWLSDLSELEQAAAQYYIEDGRRKMTTIAEAQGIEYMVMRGIIMGLPHLIWSRWYAKGA